MDAFKIGRDPTHRPFGAELIASMTDEKKVEFAEGKRYVCLSGDLSGLR